MVKLLKISNRFKIAFFALLGLNMIGCEPVEKIELVKPTIFVSTAYLLNDKKTIEVNCETLNPSSYNKEEFGIVWGEKQNPTIDDNFQYSGNNSKEEGPFTEQIKNSKPSTTLYIRGYMKVDGIYVYSKDFIYDPTEIKGWTRLEDLPREGNQILPDADGGPLTIFYQKLPGFEEVVAYSYTRFWSKVPDFGFVSPMIYDQYRFQIEYAPGVFDNVIGGGYTISTLDRKKNYRKFIGSRTFSPLAEYLPNPGPAVGFGAGNRGYVIEKKEKPIMWGLDEDKFEFTRFSDPPVSNFTDLKAAGEGKYGLLLAINDKSKNNKIKSYLYINDTNEWIQVDDFPGENRTGSVLFVLKNKAYFGLGQNVFSGEGFKDFWSFDFSTKKWSKAVNYPGAGSINVPFAKVGNSIFIGSGYSSLKTDIGTSTQFVAYDFWEFRP
jgi:hypothetical protein